MVSINTTKALSTLLNPDKVLPVALIETAGTVGRTYKGYQRGGKVEGRERLREETSTAIFWLFGVKVLNSIGNFIGKKLGLKYLDVDLGRDELRAPSLTIPKDVRLKTCAFKFGKIATSALIATALTGFILPKVNHMITDRARAKAGLKHDSNDGNQTQKLPQNGISSDSVLNPVTYSFVTAPVSGIAPTFSEFLNNAKNSAPSFKGMGDFICKLSHGMENTTVGRLISTDAGMIFGRVKNSRNPFEGFEFAFRDTSSIYFYLFATGHTAALLNKISGNTSIHPDTLEVASRHLQNEIKNYLQNPENAGKPLTPDVFAECVKKVPDDIKEKLANIPFNNKGVVSLDDFNAATKNTYSAKALKMSQMQPLLDGKSVLSRMQVEDIFSLGWNTNPKFLREAVKKGTYGASVDSKKYVARKVTENIRTSVDKFSENLVKYAKSKGQKEISADFVAKFAKHTANLNFIFRIAGILVSSLGLAVLIPKIQYKITEIRTGSKDFPGTADYSDCLNVKEKPSKNSEKS